MHPAASAQPIPAGDRLAVANHSRRAGLILLEGVNGLWHLLNELITGVCIRSYCLWLPDGDSLINGLLLFSSVFLFFFIGCKLPLSAVWDISLWLIWNERCTNLAPANAVLPVYRGRALVSFRYVLRWCHSVTMCMIFSLLCIYFVCIEKKKVSLTAFVSKHRGKYPQFGSHSLLVCSMC